MHLKKKLRFAVQRFYHSWSDCNYVKGARAQKIGLKSTYLKI